MRPSGDPEFDMPGIDHPPPSSAEVKKRLYLYPLLELRSLFQGEIYRYLYQVSANPVSCLLWIKVAPASSVPRNFFRGVQQIHLRTVGRENGDLAAVAP
jgi:hypothetical protein